MHYKVEDKLYVVETPLMQPQKTEVHSFDERSLLLILNSIDSELLRLAYHVNNLHELV